LQSHDDAQSEYALTSHDGTQHVIDRTFIENGTRWIIDYKLGLDVTEANANAVALSHKPQLTRYAALFERDNLSIKTAVFFLSLGKLIEI
jgi:ATP-dependent helicase/nuclease subunit A